jgi:hypothetical protein
LAGNQVHLVADLMLATTFVSALQAGLVSVKQLALLAGHPKEVQVVTAPTPQTEV